MLALAVFFVILSNFCIAITLTCDLSDTSNQIYRCHSKLAIKKLAGDKFRDSPRECFTGKVNDEGYCIGAAFGESCANNGDADCDVGLFCNEKYICEHALKEGDNCSRLRKCESYLTCQVDINGVEQKCKKYGSMINGEEVAPSNDPDICRSNWFSETYICQDGPKLKHSNIRENPGETCEYDIDYPTKSVCYYHSEGKALCSKGAGQMNDVFTKIIHYLDRKPKCHVDHPYAQCDMGEKVFDDPDQWADTWKSLFLLHYEPHFEGLLDCMKKFIHPDAFKYEKLRQWQIPITVYEPAKGEKVAYMKQYVDSKTKTAHFAFIVVNNGAPIGKLYHLKVKPDNQISELKLITVKPLHNDFIDCSIYGDSVGGKLFITATFKNEKTGFSEVWFSESNDNGETFSVPILMPVKNPDERVSRHSAIARYSNVRERLWIFYVGTEPLSNKTTIRYVSRAKGSTILTPETILEDRNQEIMGNPKFEIVDTTKLSGLYLSYYSEKNEQDVNLIIVNSNNNGITWNTKILTTLKKQDLKSYSSPDIAADKSNKGGVFSAYSYGHHSYFVIEYMDLNSNDYWNYDIADNLYHVSSSLCTNSENKMEAAMFAGYSLNNYENGIGEFIVYQGNKPNILLQPFKNDRFISVMHPEISMLCDKSFEYFVSALVKTKDNEMPAIMFTRNNKQF